MKRDEVTKLRELSIPELQNRAKDAKTDLFNTRFALRTGHLSDFSKVRAIRIDYAQIQTIISEKRIAQTKQGAVETR